MRGCVSLLFFLRERDGGRKKGGFRVGCVVRRGLRIRGIHRNEREGE